MTVGEFKKWCEENGVPDDAQIEGNGQGGVLTAESWHPGSRMPGAESSGGLRLVMDDAYYEAKWPRSTEPAPPRPDGGWYPVTAPEVTELWEKAIRKEDETLVRLGWLSSDGKFSLDPSMELDEN